MATGTVAVQTSGANPGGGMPPATTMMQLVCGKISTHLLYAMAKLGVADHLNDAPRTAAELAEQVGADPSALYRALRALAGLGVFVEHEGKRFSLTPVGECLRSDSPTSLRYLAIMFGEEWHVQTWGNILHSIRTGKPAADDTLGMPVFEYFERDREQAEIFNQAMTDLSRAAGNAVAEAYDYSGIRRLVDVAGGHGRLLTTLLDAHAHLEGVLFDLPHVIRGAREQAELARYDGRLTFVAGDFFSSVPEDVDGYIMKHIIHDWDDERAGRILSNCRRGLRKNGRLLVVEQVVPSDGALSFAKMADIEMLLLPGGKERTEQEFRELFAAAGFALTRVIPTTSPVSIIEGTPA